MLRDYVQHPHLPYADLFEALKSSGVSRPGKFIADVLQVAESSVNRWARERESDEVPTGTGARSDWERFALTLTHAILPYCPEVAQLLINVQQQMLDDAIEQRAEVMKNACPDHLRELAMREASDVVVAIGANKSAADILRESAESQVATKTVIALQRKQAGVKG